MGVLEGLNREGVLGSERCAGGAPLLSFCVTRATFSPRQHLAVVGARYEEPAEATADSAALLEIHANETPGGATSNTRVPPRACAAVLTTIGELLETSRTRARRGLSPIRKQLIDAGALPLVLLPVSDLSAPPLP